MEAQISTEKLIKDLFSVGAHYAHGKSRRHPTVKPYIFGIKGGSEIFDLEKTVKLLTDTKIYVESLGEKKAKILFIGGKSESVKAIEKAADDLNMPFVIGRWIGGTFTNFPEIRKRVEKLIKMKEEREKGGFAKYTKWERARLDEEIEKLEKMFGGLTDLTSMPAAVFVVDAGREWIAVEEAKKAGIPVISLMSSDCDLGTVTYPILANDASRESISFIVNEIVLAYQAGASKAKAQ